MKTKLLAGLIGACVAAPVLAQSTITIYGIADAGIHVSSNGEGTKTKLVSGIADGSRLGFKGTEDLGGGYKTVFNLEARIELDNGTQQAGNISDNQGFALSKGMVFPAPVPQLAPIAAGALAAARQAMQPAINVNTNNALFDRTALVGLVTPVGAILAGRMYTPAYEVFAAADTFETGTAGSWGGVALGSGGILAAGIAIRSDKALQYRIALPNGISAALMYGFKNSGYIGLDDKFWAANVMYKANGFNLGLGHNYGTDQNGNKGLVTTTLGGSYETGAMKFFAGYEAMKNDNSVLIPVLANAWDSQIAPALIAKGGPAALINGVYTPIFKSNLARNFKLDANSFSVGMHYTIGNGRIMGSVSHQNDKTAFNSDVTQYAIGYDYNLSKRTDIYTVLAYIKNKNDAQYAPGAASAPGGFTSEPGQAGRALQIGMRHRF
jgi:predicted porin